jgi:phage tail sheath gpL-like
MGFIFSGVDPTYKVPRYIAQIIFSAGNISASSAPLYALYVGMKTSAGTITPDSDVLEVFSEDDVDTKCGARSQLAWMARAGIRAAPTSRHFIAAVTEPAGTAATATVVLGGTWTTPGEWAFEIGGVRVAGTVGTTDAIDTVGADMASKLTGKARLPVTAGYNPTTDTLTLTCANLGAQGKDWIVKVDKSKLPAGMTLTVTGGATLGGSRVRLGASSSGTGVEDVTTLLTKLLVTRYARIAAAQNDNTNAGYWETQVNSLAGPTSLILEQLVFAMNGDQGTVETFATVQLNAPRAQVLWMQNADIHPSVIAAVKTAIRASREGTDPVPDYDGLTLPGIPPHSYDGDIPLDSVVNSNLNRGVTPVTTVNGEARVVRSITSYCRLDSVTQDERTLDIGDAVMTDYATIDLKFLYETSFRPANKYVGPDPLPSEFEPPPGVGYPRLWNSSVLGRLNDYFTSGWVEFPGANPPVSQYNKTAKAIESMIPIVVRRVQHQMRNIIRQTVP